jgi:hypothetical protein
LNDRWSAIIDADIGPYEVPGRNRLVNAATQKLVLSSILRYHGVRVTADVLAAHAGMSERAVRFAVLVLELQGLVRVLRGDPTDSRAVPRCKGSPHQYVIQWDVLNRLPRVDVVAIRARSRAQRGQWPSRSTRKKVSA